MWITLDNMDIKFENEPISHVALICLGFSHNSPCGYYCPPHPANGGLYRVDFESVKFRGGKPIKGTEKWRAYLTDRNSSTIRMFENLGELNYFHKGMCGDFLFKPNQ